MGDPIIRFFVSPELKRYFQSQDGIASALAAFPGRAGEIAHVVQTYRHTHELLARLGQRSELVDSIPSDGIVVCHRKSFPGNFKPSQDVFIVYCKGDWDIHYFGNLHVIQNPNDMQHLDPELWPAHYIPHFPQPELTPRSLKRGDTFMNIAYLGDLDNLAPELKSQKFQEDLRVRGLTWRIAEHARWHNYSDLDAIVAVRSFNRKDSFFEKPATKLFNAWHAQVPAILGAESGYRVHRSSDRDYIEVSTYQELLSALERLRDDPELRTQMKENAKTRAREVTPESIAQRWVNFLVATAIPAYDMWRRLPTAERSRFYRRRTWLKVRNYTRSKIKQFLTGEEVLLTYV